MLNSNRSGIRYYNRDNHMIRQDNSHIVENIILNE